jgi:RsiW-degrading membrane proteinase PrsW (M82 family)
MYKQAEYETLRATIRERGSVRMWVILAGLVAWGALTLALNAWEFPRAVTLVPFLILAATFEISFFIHTGVERVGRYLQVFYEDEAASSDWRGWENTVMGYGKNNPGRSDPLFITLFAGAAAVNFFASFPGGPLGGETAIDSVWIVVSFVAHVILAWRLVVARRLAANQRAVDLERFRLLKTTPVSN